MLVAPKKKNTSKLIAPSQPTSKAVASQQTIIFKAMRGNNFSPVKKQHKVDVKQKKQNMF